MSRRLLFAFAFLLVSACGGGDSNSESPIYANVNGTWQIQGTFDDFAATVTHFSGTVTFDQPSRNQAGLSAAASVAVTINSNTSMISTISSPALTTDGALTFQLNVPNAAATWTFTGQVSGSQASGTHLLTDGSAAFPGVWQATKP